MTSSTTATHHEEDSPADHEPLQKPNEALLCEECSPAALNDALADVAQQFEDYMLEDDRRRLLEQRDRRAEVRRAARHEAERRARIDSTAG